MSEKDVETTIDNWAVEASPKSVLIADDVEFWRNWLKDELLKLFPSIGENCFLTAKASEVLAKFNKERPDLVFLDIEFRGESEHGIQLAKQIWQANPSALIIIVSTHSEEVFVKTLYEATPETGNYGYILKDNAINYLRVAVNAVLSGDCWIDPQVVRIIKHVQNNELNLTPGEFEALACIALGYTDDTTGKVLNVTERAVQARLRNVYSKFGIPDKTNVNAGIFSPRCRAVWIASQRKLLSEIDLKSWAERLAQKGKEAGIKLDLR